MSIFVEISFIRDISGCYITYGFGGGGGPSTIPSGHSPNIAPSNRKVADGKISICNRENLTTVSKINLPVGPLVRLHGAEGLLLY